MESDAHLQSLLLKSPVDEPPALQQGPHGERCPPPEPYSPDPPLQVPLTELPQGQMLPFWSPLFFGIYVHLQEEQYAKFLNTKCPVKLLYMGSILVFDF